LTALIVPYLQLLLSLKKTPRGKWIEEEMDALDLNAKVL
jgi:hypothetical protein